MADGRAPHSADHVERRVLRKYKFESADKIQNVSTSLKNYFKEFGKLKNMDNQQWKILLQDPSRLENLNKVLESDRNLLNEKTKRLEKILKSPTDFEATEEVAGPAPPQDQVGPADPPRDPAADELLPGASAPNPASQLMEGFGAAITSVFGVTWITEQPGAVGHGPSQGAAQPTEQIQMESNETN